MKTMRNVLYALMMIAMFTPVLACGGFMCVKPAQAAENMPCHGEQQSDNEKHSLMLMKDCLKIDLFQADNSNTFQKPDIKISKIFYGWADIVDNHNFELITSYYIRGPPIETAAAYPTYPPVYLTTRRLRI